MSPPDVLTISAARDTAALEVLEVEANPGESTFPGEILTCRAPDDGMVRLFRKLLMTCAAFGNRFFNPLLRLLMEGFFLLAIGFS